AVRLLPAPRLHRDDGCRALHRAGRLRQAARVLGPLHPAEVGHGADGAVAAGHGAGERRADRAQPLHPLGLQRLRSRGRLGLLPFRQLQLPELPYDHGQHRGRVLIRNVRGIEMHRFWKNLIAVAVCGVVAAGCQDLTVPNLNNPERERVLQEPDDVEALIVGTWTTVWGVWQGSTYPSLPLSAVADEFTTTFEQYGAWALSSEPRGAFDNTPEYAYAAVAENPYYNAYDALASVHDGLEAILKRGIVIDDGKGNDLTPRAVAFAKFTQGTLLGYLGLLYDKAFVVTENTPIAD